jgi:hypothetical protein
MTVAIALATGAVLGVLADWLLKPLLPQNPTVKHSIAGLVACVAIVGVAVGVPAFFGSQAGEPSSKDGVEEDVVAADQVRACMRQHDLQQAQVTTEKDKYIDTGIVPEFATIKFAQCEWPPPSYAGDEGYSEIIVTVVQGPGPHEAAGETLADRIEAPCQKLKLSYSYTKMGGLDRIPPFEISANSIVTMTETGVKPWEGKLYDLHFYPERGEFVVLHGNGHRVDSAECVT